MIEIQSPQLEQAALQAVDDANALMREAGESESVSDVWLRRQSLSGKTLRRVDWKRCVIESCQITGGVLDQSDFHNIVFDRCDLSGIDFSDSIFTVARFEQCKLSGAVFAQCGLSDVLFDDCILDDAVFAASRATRLLFRQCRMPQVQLSGLGGKHYAFQQCSLVRANFHHTSLKGVDLTDSDIDGILAGGEELRGAKVTAVQASDLARLLGVIIV